MAKKKQTKPAQQQKKRPGRETQMHPRPEAVAPSYKPAGKLKGKVAIITGADSGIGRAVAAAFAMEGASVAAAYLEEHQDARETQRLVESAGGTCLLIAGDVGSESFCRRLVDKCVSKFGKLDILVNNAAEQHPQDDFTRITSKQMERTFRTNIFSMFYLTKAALEHLPRNGIIINTTSVTAYRGSDHLIDYASTKGAIVAFTRSLAKSLAPKRIRVNAVAPGPIWTPLIPSTFPRKRVKEFGADTPMGRPGEPSEVAPSYVFLACGDSSYMTGQVLHPNGGEIING